MKTARRIMGQATQSLREGSIRQEQLARVFWIVFAASIVPLAVIALFNYPAMDDFKFTLPVATAWVQTHSFGALLQAAIQKTVEIYYSWQGNFVSTFLFTVNPLIFNIDLYFLANWYLLAMLCLCVGYLVKGLTHHFLHASRFHFAILYTSVMVLVLQFMPDISTSVYWFNGGNYTVAACTLMLILGLLLRCRQAQTRKKQVVRGIALALCGFALGGSFYGPALGGFVAIALLTAASFVVKSKLKWYSLVTFLFFMISFAISVAAPGNQLRQEWTGESLGILQTVVITALDSSDLAGKWLSPQLLAALLLILPVLWKPLKESAHRFRHPVGVFVLLYGMFSASLAPGIYTGAGYQTGRYLNAIYFYFLIMIIGSAVYLEGAFIRALEQKSAQPSKAHLLAALEDLGRRFTSAYLALCLALLMFGGFAYTIMNTSSVSATKSLVTGEAAQFLAEMKERQEYIRVTDSDHTAVKALSVQPKVFKADSLPFHGIYGWVRYMKMYFELFHEADRPSQPDPQ